jgi:hypothetical protein
VRVNRVRLRDRPDGRRSAFVVGGGNWRWSEVLLGGGWLWWWVAGEFVREGVGAFVGGGK